MATRTLQPSEYDIQREVEALRDIRRRSTTPGALTIDPDLPNQSPPSSPTSYRLASPSDESSEDSASGSRTSSSSESTHATSNSFADDPFHLFWVPASLHPEIAPAEFRAFLKEHARSPPPSDDGSGTPDRSDSLSAGSGLTRRKSMLSRQYKPDEHDGVENELVVPLRRDRGSLYRTRGPQLTISDLQKLEELAEEASVSDDPSRLRNVLRRSLSLNISPSAVGQMDEMPDMLDEADAPIIVPPPGQILRRAARTKIRKPGLPGDGGGHRFGSSRRGQSARAATTPVEPRTSSEISSSDHGDSVESSSADRRGRPFSDEGLNQRPESFSEETSIFEAYAREEDDEGTASPVVITSSPPSMLTELPEEPQPPSEVQPALLEALGTVIHQPQPQRLLSPELPTEQQEPSRTPSPSEPPPSAPAERPPLPHAPPSFLSTTPSPPPQRKEKDRKGLFGKWGGDKSSKKGKYKDAESKERTAEKEKEKESGFFGSLFGSKKKQDETPPPLLSPGTSGREAAQALLGASKSKAFSPVSPAISAGIGPNNYSRYPIHVERAIYRLSHIKLANPRRPLYEQVLISNLMFWYLGVINKAQSQASANGQASVTQVPAGTADAPQADELDAERDRKEREQQELRERAERERAERERLEREQREREMEMKKKESGRKGSLTKAPAPGTPGARRAEMPVKGPQYEMQHRVMQQEYNGYAGQSQQGIPMGRSTSAPVSGNGPSYPRSQQQPPVLQHNVHPHGQNSGDHYYYSSEPGQSHQPQPRLPPGAMPPDQHMWQQSQPPRTRSSTSPPSSPGPSRSQSRSPPGRTHGRYNRNSSQDTIVTGGGGERVPSRSLSATAVSTTPMANGRVRKGTSAHAVVQTPGRRPRSSEGAQEQNGNGEEEDIPLAMWQQQRQRR
ncbi:putative activator of mitotic machinery Cdc14 phosphatase activation C-term [Lyophyllum shimeji]|uniref:Activator of mitotic machinery Cdc14 phosphatase activation C-term n=1 Tax=Lyophyllum shimeji TaxID=47721 RepID=A0A9P3PV26_LYOSH|nr:putative activator of mitotic machinery Cdc14 phosphatase activation C-term [Lyophyllum shimeji]